MFKVLTKYFIKDPVLEMDITAPTEEVVLFGKVYRMYADDWKKHVHLKCTNRCDANCRFCIERDSRHDYEDMEGFISNTRELIGQLKAQGQFRTLSVTGGEPTVFPKLQLLVDIANQEKPTLFSINTNGFDLVKSIAPGTLNGWVNISKHAIDDSLIFRRPKSLNVTPEYIREFKRRQPFAHVRLQCVLGMEGGLTNLNDILKFMDYFGEVADDFSFRSLIVDTDHDKIPQLFTDLRNFLFDSMVEQAIQDYYVYEVYNYHGRKITLSWSNMFLLRNYNESHADSNFLEEIIVHPDGMITGSWNKQTLIIKPSWQTEHSGLPSVDQQDEFVNEMARAINASVNATTNSTPGAQNYDRTYDIFEQADPCEESCCDSCEACY